MSVFCTFTQAREVVTVDIEVCRTVRTKQLFDKFESVEYKREFYYLNSQGKYVSSAPSCVGYVIVRNKIPMLINEVNFTVYEKQELENLIEIDKEEENLKSQNLKLRVAKSNLL